MSSNYITTYLDEGTAADLPAAPAGTPSSGALCLYYATDTKVLYRWNGSSWDEEKWLTAITGDMTTAAGPGSVVGTLATVNSDVGSYTNASITVNAKGLVTAASSGSGGSLEVTDGTNSVSSTTTLTMEGGLVGGSGGSATWTPASLNVDAITVSGSTQTLTPTKKIGKYALTLEADVTFTMSGGSDGMVVLLELIQDATGSRTVAFDSSVQFGTDITSFTASTAANTVDYVLLQYSADLSKWCFMSYVRGF